jgi:hypothetical protein
MQNHNEHGHSGDAIEDDTGLLIVTTPILVAQSSAATQDNSADPNAIAQSEITQVASI